MATQAGHIHITGSIGETCFYKMKDNYFARKKSSLTGTRVKKDPAFRETMHHASLLARTAKIVSAFYSSLPAEKKGRKKYLQLISIAFCLLKKGESKEKVHLELKKAIRDF